MYVCMYVCMRACGSAHGDFRCEEIGGRVAGRTKTHTWALHSSRDSWCHARAHASRLPTHYAAGWVSRGDYKRRNPLGSVPCFWMYACCLGFSGLGVLGCGRVGAAEISTSTMARHGHGLTRIPSDAV